MFLYREPGIPPELFSQPGSQEQASDRPREQAITHAEYQKAKSENKRPRTWKDVAVDKPERPVIVIADNCTHHPPVNGDNSQGRRPTSDGHGQPQPQIPAANIVPASVPESKAHETTLIEETVVEPKQLTTEDLLQKMHERASTTVSTPLSIHGIGHVPAGSKIWDHQFVATGAGPASPSPHSNKPQVGKIAPIRQPYPPSANADHAFQRHVLRQKHQLQMQSSPILPGEDGSPSTLDTPSALRSYAQMLAYVEPAPMPVVQAAPRDVPRLVPMKSKFGPIGWSPIA